jgi:hypothetical protein
LIETPHTGEECLDLIKVLNAQGYPWNFDWGCKAGIHSGWAIIEAENEAQAGLVVPPLVRTQARIVKLNKFDGSAIEDCAKQEPPLVGVLAGRAITWLPLVPCSVSLACSVRRDVSDEPGFFQAQPSRGPNQTGL